MIDDPILFSGPDTWWEKIRNISVAAGDVFVRTIYPDSKHNLALYLFDEHNIPPLFYIVGNMQGVGLTEMTKDIFIDHLMEHHPDHLEWLLFHPEWLN